MNEVSYGAHGFFNRRVRINAVLVVEVDHLDIKSFEA